MAPPPNWRLRRAGFLLYKWGFVATVTFGPLTCWYVHVTGGLAEWFGARGARGDEHQLMGGGAAALAGQGGRHTAAYGIRRHFAALRGEDMPAPNPRAGFRDF